MDDHRDTALEHAESERRRLAAEVARLERENEGLKEDGRKVRSIARSATKALMDGAMTMDLGRELDDMLDEIANARARASTEGGEGPAK